MFNDWYQSIKYIFFTIKKLVIIVMERVKFTYEASLNAV